MPLARPTVLFTCFLLSAVFPALAQTTAQAPALLTTPSPAVPWTTLTTAQKAALMPLEGTWTSLTDGQQRKWLVISQNYGNMSDADKEKLHSRMGEWAALKPKERQQARLNFAETKKTPAAERAANWEAYQALSPEEKEALAKKAAPAKPTGAAIATKPAAPQKLTPVPLTRNSPDKQREKVAAQQALNPNTLLPVPTSGKAAANSN